MDWKHHVYHKASWDRSKDLTAGEAHGRHWDTSILDPHPSLNEGVKRMTINRLFLARSAEIPAGWQKRDMLAVALCLDQLLVSFSSHTCCMGRGAGLFKAHSRTQPSSKVHLFLLCRLNEAVNLKYKGRRMLVTDGKRVMSSQTRDT